VEVGYIGRTETSANAATNESKDLLSVVGYGCSVVCVCVCMTLCVCLLVKRVRFTKAAEPIAVLFSMRTRVAQ